MTYNAILNEAERDDVIRAVQAAAKLPRHNREGALFVTDHTKAKWLAEGEKAIGVVGGFRNMIVFSPAGARNDEDSDRYLFFGRTGVICHEEHASAGFKGLIASLSLPLADA